MFFKHPHMEKSRSGLLDGQVLSPLLPIRPLQQKWSGAGFCWKATAVSFSLSISSVCKKANNGVFSKKQRSYHKAIQKPTPHVHFQGVMHVLKNFISMAINTLYLWKILISDNLHLHQFHFCIFSSF
jgi:hypothetical protein